VVGLTPKDTGRAAAGWTPWSDTQPTPIPVTDSKGTGIAQGKADGSFTEDLRGGDQSISITNGVPYIVPLEYGHSQKATGMVRVNLRRIREKIDVEAQKNMERNIRAADAKTRGVRG
jgi:hypothetical protein